MTHYPDLTAYTYYDDEIWDVGDEDVCYRPTYERQNVGWLDRAHPYPTGPVPDGFADALLDITATQRVNVMRGFHMCNLCSGPSPDHMLSVEHRGTAVYLGHSEIRVRARPGLVFAAPSLLWHYVTQHRYQPPAGFVAAVASYDEEWVTGRLKARRGA